MLCDWSRKLAPLSQPIRCKTYTNHDLVTCVFPRFRQFGNFSFSSHWLLKVFSFLLIGRWDYFGFGFRHSIESVTLFEFHNWSKDLAQHSQPTRCKIRTKPSLPPFALQTDKFFFLYILFVSFTSYFEFFKNGKKLLLELIKFKTAFFSASCTSSKASLL